jgi:hypothetical protein
MLHDRTHHLTMHLTLALAGVCLSCAEAPFLPEILVLLPVYVGLVALSWRRIGGWAMPAWAANLLGVGIVAGAGLWMAQRIGDGDDTWSRDVPVAVLLIPHLGPVLMALLLVRLFRPRQPGEFWALQGYGLLQVALGCALASGTLFGACLLAYLVVGVCAVAFHEQHTQAGRGVAEPPRVSGVDPHSPSGRQRWLAFGLRWAPAVAVLVVPLFLLTPRFEVQEWDPLARFGVKNNKEAATTGFSEEIDLRRTGRLELDNSLAFTVRVTDSSSGKPVRSLSGDQRWRGMVLDKYENGVWKINSALSWPSVRVLPTTLAPSVAPNMEGTILRFRVPRRAGALFTAEPAILGPRNGMLPVVGEEPASKRRLPLFFEAAGTVVSLAYLTEPEYRYLQVIPPGASRERFPVVRVNDSYKQRLLDNPRPSTLGAWSLDLLRRLARQRYPDDQRLRDDLDRQQERTYLPPVHWERVARLLTEYLGSGGEFTYSLERRRQDRQLDPVEDFLFNVKQGPCECYASALTLLLRSRGIMARIVKGFRGAEYQGEGTYLVRNNQAHAWVEAIVPSQQGPGYEWLIFDPTPPDPESSTSALERLQLSGQALWRDLIMGYTAGDQADLWDDLINGRRGGALVPVLGLALVGAGLWWLVQRRRLLRAHKAGQGNSLYSRLLELMDRHARLRPRPEETPGELAGRAAAFLAGRSATRALADVPAQVVTVWYAIRYGGRTPAEPVMRETSSRLDALAAALRRG